MILMRWFLCTFLLVPAMATAGPRHQDYTDKKLIEICRDESYEFLEQQLGMDATVIKRALTPIQSSIIDAFLSMDLTEEEFLALSEIASINAVLVECLISASYKDA